MAGEKTEKATPKKRDEAQRKGNMAKSADLNGATLLLVGLFALSAFGPGLMRRMEESTVDVLRLVKHPEVVSRDGIGTVLRDVFSHVALGLAPVLFACVLAAVVSSVGQSKGKLATKAIKPDFKKLNPLSGLKNLFSPNSAIEAVKGLLKVAMVGAVVFMAVYPKLDELAALVGLSPVVLLTTGAGQALHLAQLAALAYLAIGFADYFWQRYRVEKSIKMDKQEVKDEFKNQDLPAEVKSALRRKAIEAARARMMDAIPTADVVVTNPTHFSVALRYDAEHLAPVVVAKGMDHIAFTIRELARDAGVPVVPDPPLARALHASVEVGQIIPEELYQAVAQLLAYVYRVAGRRAAAGAAA
jgi:flagellar biosynthetic protein FlhB